MAHGQIIIDAQRCKGCELCRSACPPQLIGLADAFNSKGYRPAIFVDPESRCTSCALCAVVCPDVCITVYRQIPQQKRGPVAGEEGLEITSSNFLSQEIRR